MFFDKKMLKRAMPILMGGVVLVGCGAESNHKNESETNSIAVQTEHIEPSKKVTINFETINKPDIVTTTQSAISTTTSTTAKTVTTTTYTSASTGEEPIVTTDFVSSESVVSTSSNETFTTAVQEEIKPLYQFDCTGRYAYLDQVEQYVVNEGDTIPSICDKFKVHYDQFDVLNPGVEAVNPGDVINYSSKSEYYITRGDEELITVSIQNGVHVNELRSLNNYSDDVQTVSGMVLLHKFYGWETSYDTSLGVSNVIRNNKIYGDKIVYATGFSGASNYFLALQNSRFIAGNNMVFAYEFAGDNSYTSKMMCSNARGIGSIDGMPVIYPRTTFDIVMLVNECGIDISDPIVQTWITKTDYETFVNDNGVTYIPMNANNVQKTK